ncbi:hypothetical protein ACLK19_06635 [Escherichia coli]
MPLVAVDCFGAKGPQLPAPNMLMMDRVVKMTETVVTSTKGMLKQNWISIESVVLRMPLYWQSGYAGMRAWTQCGSW